MYCSEQIIKIITIRAQLTTLVQYLLIYCDYKLFEGSTIICYYICIMWNSILLKVSTQSFVG